MLKLKTNRKLFMPTLLIVLVLLSTVILNWSQIESLGVSTVRNTLASYNRNIVYKDFNWLIGEHVDVVYTDSDSDLSQFILDLSEESFGILQQKYSFTPNARPLVVIYPSYKELLDSLGWDENNKASGVYQSGTIKLVSPKAWYPVGILEDIKTVYQSYGPLHHEMTHLFVDYITRGNYQDWYTEALAQLEELKLLNIEWIDENNQNPEYLYTFSQLTNSFYRLENQSLAYRQSLTIGIYLEETYGEDTHLQILEQLSKGNSFKSAVKKLYGVTFEELEESYTIWINSNWEKYF